MEKHFNQITHHDETKKRAHCLDLHGVWFETDNLEKSVQTCLSHKIF